MAFSLIKQSRKIIKKTFVVSLTSNKPPGCIFCKTTLKAISGKKFYILIFRLCMCLSSVSIKYFVSLHSSLYTHIINKLLHGWFVCTIFVASPRTG